MLLSGFYFMPLFRVVYCLFIYLFNFRFEIKKLWLFASCLCFVRYDVSFCAWNIFMNFLYLTPFVKYVIITWWNRMLNVCVRWVYRELSCSRFADAVTNLLLHYSFFSFISFLFHRLVARTKCYVGYILHPYVFSSCCMLFTLWNGKNIFFFQNSIERKQSKTIHSSNWSK